MPGKSSEASSGAPATASRTRFAEHRSVVAADPMPARQALLEPGVSCWKKVSAARLAVIQDAGATFAAIASTMLAAETSIFILGWDLDSRTVLRPGSAALPELRLLPLLLACLDRHPALQIFVLLWDFSVIYAWEREAAPQDKFGRAHPRLHFAMDGTHPLGGSHHQKVVVVDDAVAFVGGIDLTLHRWDTPEHLPVDERRKDRDGLFYPPFHDVHAAVSGAAAQALGELARMRWARRDARMPLPPVCRDTQGPWPAELDADASDVEIGLARTDACLGHAPVREVEALTLAAVMAAQRWIYVENQYLTSASVCRALGAQLARPGGPEVLLLLPQVESGWLEQSSMGILRAQAFAALLRKDVHARLRLLTPTIFEDGQRHNISVHSKVLVVDDRLAKIGSANLSSRSMGLDTECDLAIEAVDARTSALVASVRDRLLAEHLGSTAGEVAARLAAHGSLCRLVDEHPAQARRGLSRVPMVGNPPLDLALLEGAVVDPPGPWSASLMLDHAVPVPLRRRLARRWLRPLLLVALAIAGWLVLRHWASGAAHLRGLVDAALVGMARRPAGPVFVILFYTVAGVAFVPVTVLATTTLAVFGIWPGIPLAWTGSILSAVLSHAAGKRLGTRVMAWLPSRVEKSVRRFLARQSFWAVVFMRLVPLGNFGALNLAAGALGIPRKAFVAGNMVGLLPGLCGLGLVVDRTLALLARPNAVNVVVFAIIAAAVIGLSLWMRRRYRPAARRKPGAPSGAAAQNAGQSRDTARE